MWKSKSSPRALRLRRRRPAWPLVAAMCASLWLAGCRLDMHLQPRYNPEVEAPFFPNDTSAQEPVPGTVARGQLRTDQLLYTGEVNGVLASVFPFPITAQDLDRGRERYNIYCSPCHGYAGYGDGMIVQRGFPAPPSFHSDRLRQVPVGHFVSVMTNGFGLMYSYASRVTPEDRWRIAAYIRALQYSQHAAMADVPAAQTGSLESQP